MSRRVSLPAADDLFRPTATPDDSVVGPAAQKTSRSARGPRAVESVPEPPAVVEAPQQGKARTSGRVRHDEKMTVYMTSDELLEIEHARLMLRKEYGLAVDRGRLVRQAVAVALAELEEHGADSQLIERLRDS